MNAARNPSKSALIRQYFAEHPQASSHDAAEALRADGIQVDARYAAQIRSKAKRGSRSPDEGRRSRSKRTDGPATTPPVPHTSRSRPSTRGPTSPTTTTQPPLATPQANTEPPAYEVMLLAAELIQKAGSAAAAQQAIQAAIQVAQRVFPDNR